MGVFCGMLVVAITGSWLLAAVASMAAVIGLVALERWERRQWPPAIPMQRLDTAARQEALRLQPPPGAALLFAVCDDASVARVEVLVDGTSVGELVPGSGMVVRLRPGRRSVSLRAGPFRRNEATQAAPGQVLRLRAYVYIGRGFTIEAQHVASEAEFIDADRSTLLQPLVAEV